MSPRVSVVMPVRDGAAHLAPAVRGVLAQTCADLELVVVDDGSTDDTLAVLDRVADDRVRVVSQAPGGIVSALNTGLDHAKGEYVARMDADDLIAPQRLARQVAFLDAHPSVVACGTDYAEFGARSGLVRMPRTPAACRARLSLGTCIAHPSAMVRAAALDGIRYRPGYEYAEDYRLFSELSAVGDLANLAYVGLHYRQHAVQLSAVRRDAQREVTLRVAAENLVRAGLPAPDPDALAALIWPGPGAGAFLRYLAVSAPRVLALAARTGGAAGALDGLRFVRERLNTALRTRGAGDPQHVG